jgi:hypothetical protein
MKLQEKVWMELPPNGITDKGWAIMEMAPMDICMSMARIGAQAG